MKKLAVAMVVSMGLAGATGVYAANQGELGSTSTGDFDITFVKNGQIQIKNLEDLTIPQTADRDDNLVAWNNKVCVEASIATSYSITAVTSNGVFALRGSGDNAPYTDAPYTVHYADGVDAPASVTLDSSNELENGVTASGFKPESINGCASAGNTSTVWVKLAAAAIPSVDGTYSDTVTLTVAPE